jgi:hypothetical protein
MFPLLDFLSFLYYLIYFCSKLDFFIGLTESDALRSIEIIEIFMLFK